MEDKLRILILEDSLDDANLVKRELTMSHVSFVSMVIDTQEEFENALDSFRPDIILSDHSLPQFNSFEALTICRKKNVTIPFILVTGSVSEEYAVESMKNGADDYILKANLSRLPQAIRHALRHHRQEELRTQNEGTLMAQNAELTKINHELDSFVYSVSHNLRAPLASILGLSQVAIMHDKKNQVETDEYFSKILKSTLKLDDTIKEILDYSRNARTLVRNTRIDLDTLISESVEHMKYIKEHQRVELKFTVDTDIPFYSDTYRVSVILDNLISNAYKYVDTKVQKSFIHINASVNMEQVTIKIHDNGIGIGSEYLKDIFSMFFRATENSTGAGLGLFIVNEMVEKLEGTIAVVSTLHEETIFTLVIPNNLPEEIQQANGQQLTET